MKDNSLDGHRGKVALSDTTRNAARISANSTVGLKCELKSPPSTAGTATTVSANDGSAATNFDDDYNEWELGIGDLIIDLDADIEKTNERNGGGNTQQGIPSQHGHHHHHHSSHHHGHHQSDSASSPGSGSSSTGNSSIIDSPNSSSSATAFNFLGTQTTCNNNLAAAMSNSKSPRLAVSSGAGSGTSGTAAGTGTVPPTGSTSNGANAGAAGTFEHQATVDKGLKMKIKRKTVGSKYSEAKHEIVQSDTKSASHASSENTNNVANNSSSSASASNSPATNSDTPKSKHSSSKGRNSSHREKKEKNRDKDKNSSARNTSTAAVPIAEVNGVAGVMSPLKIANSDTNAPSPAPPSLCSNASPLPSSNTSVASPSIPRSMPAATVANSPVSNSSAAPEVSQPPVVSLPNQVAVCASSSSPPMPNLTVKLEHKFAPSPSSQSCPVPSVVIKPEERPASPPLKKIKLEDADGSDEVERPGSPSIEMKDTSTCTTSTSVGTITEPDCLGPCEPGTSVTLEGIVWQETEGGVLVVNVTWRGKTYVGTLLDCTKHDWAPPRFCESPTSDVDSKTGKGRGKRGRGGNNSSSEVATFTDTRNCVQSKLRNGKGRRTTINSNAANSGFTVPNSPAKNENSTQSTKRKGRPTDPEPSTPVDSKMSKRSRNQNRVLPTAAASPVPSASPATTEPPSSQPSSPQWITCPEPNCSKRYKHINGLKYHKAHAHSTSDSSKMDDTTTEDSKDVTNSSDNEESMQESASVSTSPTPSFANSVPSHTTGKILLNENASSSSSSSVNGLPETDPYSLTTDLSTLASVAISDSTSGPKAISPSRIAPPALHSTVSQDISLVSSDGDSVVQSSTLPVSVSNDSPNPVPLSDVLPSLSLPSSEGSGLSAAVSAVTTSVIQSSNSLDNVATSQAASLNIPTPHVIFSQGILAPNNSATYTYTTSTVVCNNSNSLSPSISNLSTNVTTTFAAISSITSTSISSPTTPLPMMDKSKIKQEKPDKYKPKSPLGSSPIRPIVPAPTPLIALSTNMPGSHPGMNIGSHCLGASLKPIQPKPTILGEPSTVNPSLEGLRKDKSKHKKKSKDRERDKKIPSLPLTPTKLGMNPSEDCEALELTSYPSLEAVSGPLSTTHPILSPLISQSKPPDTSMDLSLPEDTMNENVQSPAYSDISDANDTAPVLESEVPSGKEKEDKVGKSTPDASQSPATNISAYGMYPYYSQPPYLLPSVSPQAAVSQGQNIIDKNELSKKGGDPERVKDRPWSNPSGDMRERQHLEHHEMEKKQAREDNVQASNPMASAPGSGVPVQEYPMSQHYPYPYGYVQGYPYPVDSSSYHMHMLESDPHYKQQYKQYLDEHHRMYKEQQHHQQQQQLQQHMQQAAAHQQQQQQQQQQQVHHGHHQSHHQGHHQSSKSHHSVIKEERDRSRDGKDRSASLDKMSNSGMMSEHSSKIQHSSNPLVSNKDQDVREIDMRPPSLPAQARIESSAQSASAVALKEKQNENHQILKENIELKSQMDDSKNKINQYEMAMIYERHKEDMRRFYMCQDRMIEQQQQKMEPGIHHHTHHHQTIQSHSQLHASSYSSSSLKSLKDDLSGSLPVHPKSNHYGESARSSSVVSPAKSDHIKNLHSTSSPKGSTRDRDSSMGSSKEYLNSASNRESSSSKKESKNSESSSREDKKADKSKPEVKVESEGQKPTMETTGPPPPPTNSYAYLHPSYLQPAPPHFAHMPFEPPHAAMYRGGINPMIVSTPHYPNSPYMHPQIRYVTPGPCELPVHPPPEAMNNKLHPAGPPKALDLLHQVSQQYTTTHKIHELSEHAVMSPTPASTASSTTPSTSSSSSSGKTSTSEPAVAISKVDSGSRDASRSPPTQRHLHTHHHTHVGVGYPIYDPYGGIITPGPTPAVECKPIHPLQVKPSAPSTTGPRFGWP